MKYQPKYGRQVPSITYYYNSVTMYIIRNQLNTGRKDASFPKKGDLTVTDNYRCITLT